MNQSSTCGRNGAEQHTVFRPSVDILESPADVVLVADVPGVDEAHLDVTLDKNVLTIRGKVETPAFEGYTPSAPSTASAISRESLPSPTTSTARASRPP